MLSRRDRHCQHQRKNGGPAAIIHKLHEAIDAALADPKLMTQFAGIGSVPKSMTPADFGKFIAEDTEQWAKVIRGANIKPESPHDIP
jgi:tripartite-type tricarboxylate transporter receptor subunit TctC